MNWLTISATILLTFKLLTTNGEYYSSMDKMSVLFRAEGKQLERINKFIGNNEDNLNFLKIRLAEYEREHQEALNTGPVYFENPINKYLLIKRLTSDWDTIEKVMLSKEEEKRIKILKKRILNETELHGALDGLLRLQDVYQLRSTDIASGILQGIRYEAHFNARHCFDIAKRALATTLPRLAYAWLTEALKRLTTVDNIDTLDITLAIAEAKFKLGDIHGANQTYSDLVNHYPDSEKVAKLYAEFSQNAEGKESVEVDYTLEHQRPPTHIDTAPRHDLYKYTCAGLNKKTPHEERYLRCGYLTETHPFLTLAPIKVEELNHDPLLVLYHEVMSDTEINTLRQIIKGIYRAMVSGVNGSIVSEDRISQSQFMPVTHHPILAAIDRRVEDMTNLDTKYYEQHQFANYGIGGHYAEHYDYFKESSFKKKLICNIDMGNRIATVLFYLSDVEQGGGTAFPYMKQLTMPKKGSAVFWYNLHASGVPDERTLHGGCPIIVGSKWVQNRWIREHDQSERRPCYTYNDAPSA